MTCAAEQSIQSTLTERGVVLDKERVARLVYWSGHTDDNGDLSTGAIPSDDFLKPARGGWSVTRIDVAPTGWADALGGQHAVRRPDYAYQGYFSALVREVRDIKTKSGERVFCVVDDGTNDDPHHALVTVSDNVRVGLSKAEFKPFRERLRLLFSQNPVFVN